MSIDRAQIPTEGEKNTRGGMNCVDFFKFSKSFSTGQSLIAADKIKHKDR